MQDLNYDVNNVFSNQFESFKCYWRQDELDGVCLCIIIIIFFYISLSFKKFDEFCFAVKLQKCFVNFETSLDFPSAWEWDDDWCEFSFFFKATNELVKR